MHVLTLLNPLTVVWTPGSFNINGEINFYDTVL